MSVIKQIKLTETQQKIVDVCMKLSDFLIEKNRKYGNSALEPIRIMSKSPPDEQIKVRMDDKLSRLISSQRDDEEDAIRDLVGYWVLLQVLGEDR